MTRHTLIVAGRGWRQMRIRENAESIAFYGGEANEKRVLMDRFRLALDNLGELV